MTQTQNIKRHLSKRGTITPIQALNLYGCFRLASRINDLRNEGHLIDTEMVTKDGKTFAKYRLKKLAK